MPAPGVKFALHDIIFTVHWGQPARRFDQDQAIHAIADVHAHWGRGTVINVQTWIECGERKSRAMAWRRKRGGRPTAGASHGMQVDIVGHFAAGVVVEMEFDQVPLADPNEFPWHLAAKGPEGIVYPRIQVLHDFTHLDLDDDLGRIIPRDRRRHERGIRQDRVLLALYGRWGRCHGEGSEEDKGTCQRYNHTSTPPTCLPCKPASRQCHRVSFRQVSDRDRDALSVYKP